MNEQLRIVLTVARSAGLARIELAYLGFNMAEYATWMAILVYAYRHGGAGVAALVALVQLIPSGLIAPFAAYAGDRFRRERVLLAGYLLQGVTLGMTAAALYTRAPIALVVGFATLAAVSLTTTRPVHAVILPSITHTPADLTAANAVSSVAENLGILLGPLLGGLLLARSEPGDVFVAFSGVTFLAALLTARLPIRVDALTLPGDMGARDVLRGSVAAFGVLRDERRVLLLVLVMAAGTVVIGALDILFVAAAIDLLRAGDSWAGFLYAAFGLGGVVGAMLTVTLVGRRRLTPSLASSGALFGLPIALIGLAPTVATASVLFAVGGAGFSVTTVAGRTLLQRIAPEVALARIFGILEGLAMFALALGSLASGILVETLGVGRAFLVAGLFVPIILVVAWVELRALDRDARPPDQRALALLRGLPIFTPLSAPSIERILAELTWLDVPAGTVVIREGDPGDRYYIVSEGHVEVTLAGAHLSDRGPGDGFGDIALLRNVPRTASVTARTALRLIAIERDRFLEAVTGHPRSRERAESDAIAQLAVGGLHD